MRALAKPENGGRGGRVAPGAAVVVVLVSVVLQMFADAARAAPSDVRIGGRFDTYGIVQFDNASPSQRPLARLDLHIGQRLGSRFTWYLSLVGRWGGPPKNTVGAGAFALDRTFQNFTPSLEFGESYLAYRGDQVDLRLGLQKFFWGRLDSIQPNDVLSPREYEDPFLTDAVDAKIATPALSATYYPRVPDALEEWLEEPEITLIWQPIAVPWRFPLLAERWFPPTGKAPSVLEVPATEGLPCPCRIGVEQQTVNSPAPARRFDNGNVGIRLAARIREVDWSLTFFDGYDSAPAFEVPIQLQLAPGGSGSQTIGTANTQLRPAYRRFQAVGTDAAFSLGRFTFRGEANWRFRRPYSMDLANVADRVIANPAKRNALIAGKQIVEPAFVQRDSFAWGLGADTITNGVLTIFEVYQLVILHNDQPLLVRNVDTRFATNISRRFLRDRLEAQVVGIWDISAGYELVRSQVSYDVTDGLELRLGILGIWGRGRSLVGQYARNSEVFGGVRYYF